MFNDLDHTDISSLSELKALLQPHGVQTILIKKLAKNNNDKNQVYFHHDASLLNSIFELDFSTRDKSTSNKKSGQLKGKPIQEARFVNFQWVATDRSLHPVEHCKGILYHQYPEVRLSGFKSISGLMPSTMSVDYVKKHPNCSRYLAIGATQEGKAIALMIVEPEPAFSAEFQTLPFYANSKICRHIALQEEIGSNKLLELLKAHVAGKDMKGCRLKSDGKTVPFTGTQVHGYTLEHALGIRTNAGKDGDIFGIELKCFTNKKLTLFTPEPDGGLYHESFEEFMTRYGYAKEAVYRFTGLHRAGSISEKTELALEVVCSPKGNDSDELSNYNPDKPLSHQLNKLQVILKDSSEVIAASWSANRLLNSWGVKHREAVYVPAQV